MDDLVKSDKSKFQPQYIVCAAIIKLSYGVLIKVFRSIYAIFKMNVFHKFFGVLTLHLSSNGLEQSRKKPVLVFFGNNNLKQAF